MRKFVFAILGILIALSPMPGSCDTRNGLANALGALQATDCVTTVAMLRAPNTFERDPLAKPVSHSLPLCLGAAGGLNLLVRKSHIPLWVIRLAIMSEALLVANNERVLIHIRVGK